MLDTMEKPHITVPMIVVPPNLKEELNIFISRDAMNIMSLGPEVVDKYFENGLIHTPADLFRLTLHEWDKQWYLTIGEFQAPTLFAPLEEKRAMMPVSRKATQKILDGIAKAKTVSFDRLLLLWVFVLLVK